MFYLVKTPTVLKKLYPSCTWNFSRQEKIIYLTFDDGPHPVATRFVLETLQRFNARATFFCIGKNVVEHPDIYKKIISDGHTTGNHTFNHLNGWKTPDKEYIENVRQAKKYIDSNLFRPPYGRISKFQVRLLTDAENKKEEQLFRIIMWDVLSGDFDQNITPEKCTANVTKNAREGSVVVFHDSEKAFPRLEQALPESLKFFVNKGYTFQSLPA
jgi:peptidoglycan/xylan/chitin deacetylase (PgdA/CDA1 family)